MTRATAFELMEHYNAERVYPPEEQAEFEQAARILFGVDVPEEEE